MQRLTGLDASFLYSETPTLLMHTLKVMVLAPLPFGVDDLANNLQHGLLSRLHLLPPFRRRLVEVPLGLHHPVWIEDPDFDLALHLHHATVPAPGTQSQLDEVVSEIAGKPLDRSRPLWELWLVDGLEGGSVAVVVKIHHAVADGLAAARLVTNVLTAQPSETDPRAPTWVPDRIPSSWQLLRAALADRMRQLLRLPALLLKTATGLMALLRDQHVATVATPRPMLDTPRTSFNRALTSSRSFATTSLSLDEAREVKEAFGVTLNDVVLAVVAGALRSYLGDRGELPSRPLVATVPTTTDQADDAPRLCGNKLSNLFTSLATDIEDPLARLRAIHAGADQAKHRHKLLGAELMGAWAEYIAPRPHAWAVRQWSRFQLADTFPAPANVIVSNVRGPEMPLFAPGHRLCAIYSVGPILEGIGLTITVWSYLDQMHFGVLACRELTPDAHLITGLMSAQLAELLRRARDAAPDATRTPHALAA